MGGIVLMLGDLINCFSGDSVLDEVKLVEANGDH